MEEVSVVCRNESETVALAQKALENAGLKIVSEEKGLNDSIGLELVTTCTGNDGKQHIYSVDPFQVIKREGNLYTFQAKHKIENAGSFKVSYRMFPKNPDLPHRQDFCYVRWFI